MAFASAAIVALGVLIAVRLWYPSDSTTSVSTDDVLARYRTGAASTTVTSSVTTVLPVPSTEVAEPAWPSSGSLRLPEPGVYVYDTQGMETIDALTGATHDYPAKTTITVTPDSCGVRMRWDALEERGDEHVLCVDGDRLIEPSLKEHHQFFGRLSDESYVCAPATVVLDIRLPAGQSSSGTCTNEHEDITSTWTNMGVQAVETGAGEVDAIVLRNTFSSGVSPDETGKLQSEGEWGETVFCLHASGLPVKITRTKVTRASSPVGDVNYHETFELTLGSFEPMR